MTRVAALVVTRDRHRLLIECLSALRAQTVDVGQIIVFDNASSDGTREQLETAGLLDDGVVRYERSEVNLGGAGGFAEVLSRGVATEAEWLWLMDDDAEPAPDALERLLAAPAAGEPGVAALCTAVAHPDGSIDPLHRCRLGRFVTPLPLEVYAPGQSVAVDCASFVGLLVRRTVAEAVGLPHREYFLGYDDAEYSLRIRHHGEIRLVPESSMTHKIVIGGGSETRRARWCNRLLGAHYTASPWPSYWKDLYRVRNLVAMKVEHERIGPGELIVLALGYVAKTVLYEDRPWRRIPWLLRFIRLGWRRCFDAPPPEDWQRWATGSS